MVSVFDLIRLIQHYPFGSISDPKFAFCGGTAVQCWLYPLGNNDERNDIDIFSFKSAFLNSILNVDCTYAPLLLGGFVQDKIVPHSFDVPVQLQVCRRNYFDSEIIPTQADLRWVTVLQTLVPVLSTEFLVISKLSYPNVHRPRDFQDILALNQQYILNADCLATLLLQTSLGKLIDAYDILNLKTQDDLQVLVDSIKQQLIKRFLYWKYVNVEVLNPYQLFVLLDVGNEFFNLFDGAYQYIDTILLKNPFTGRRQQIAKLGLCFLIMGVSGQNLTILERPEFQKLIQRGLSIIPSYPSFWLVKSKIVFKTIQQITCIEKFTGNQFDSIIPPGKLIRIIERIFFDDLSRFTLLALVKSLYHDLETGEISISDCVDFLSSI